MLRNYFQNTSDNPFEAHLSEAFLLNSLCLFWLISMEYKYDIF